MQELTYKIGNRLAGMNAYLLITNKLTEFIPRIVAKYSCVDFDVDFLHHEKTTFCLPHFFSYSFIPCDGSLETTAGRVVSPYSTMVLHGFRSKEARRARKKKYRSRQTSSHSSLLVARQSDVPRKLNQAKIATMNCRTLSSDVRVHELQQLASDRSIDVLAVQEHKRTSLDVH